MTKNVDAASATGIMTRLAANEEGNIIAIMAAAIIPVIGLIGGAVDISRLYLTQARLQGACDAGALIGRKTMGVGNWDDNAEAKAFSMFDHNFQNGAYGTKDIQRNFEEEDGNVTGTASTAVPMALMQVLGIKSKLVSVNCQAELRIPHTDVMFVLDTTGSMEQMISSTDSTGNTTTTKKITGLRVAVNCFYEALAKQNITDVSAAECQESADPTQTNTGAVQLRFGFVPYAVNVNVGKLLPHEYMVDEWTYQSRVAKMSDATTDTISYGPEGPRNMIGNPVIEEKGDSAWTKTNRDITNGGITYGWWSRTSAAECARKSTPPADNIPTTTRQLAAISSAGGVQTRTYKIVTITGTKSYRYVASGNQSNPLESADCTLYVKITGQRNETQAFVTETPILTSRGSTFVGWTYKPVTYNVSGLKGSSSNSWNPSLSLPLGDQGTEKSITWHGCIEERTNDLDIDGIPTPSDNTTKWAPQLNNAVYHRYKKTSFNGIEQITDERTLEEVYIGRYDGINLEPPYTSCPSESKTLQVWAPGNFFNYVNNLTTGGATYHNIGLLWGAFILSPTGIFKDINAPDAKNVERHLVFMTDGETEASEADYTPYGIAWYDRRQTQKNVAPTKRQIDDLVNARTAQLCTDIKAKNIKLWVVSYGRVGAATETMLEKRCDRRQAVSSVQRRQSGAKFQANCGRNIRTSDHRMKTGRFNATAALALNGDERGASIMEFGLIAPVVSFMLLGTMDIGHSYFVSATLDGALQSAARSSALEGSATVEAQRLVDKRVTEVVSALVPGATITVTRRYYQTFSEAASLTPEVLTENPATTNKRCDKGETFMDSNKNGLWDADGRSSGQGGAKDIVILKYKVSYTRLFPMAKMVGWPANVELESSSILANQPYGEQAEKSAPITITCS